jgi:uncharacterized protein (DUF2147 family)
MRSTPCFFAVAMLSAAFAGPAQAQVSPVGNWNTVDDKTGEIKSEVQIVEKDGVVTGSITKLLSKAAKQDAVCDKCNDDRKDKPILGMQIIRGVKKNPEKPYWDGGRILDPESGATYGARLTPIEGGAKLEMRGSLGPFGRTQTWVRAK